MSGKYIIIKVVHLAGHGFKDTSSVRLQAMLFELFRRPARPTLVVDKAERSLVRRLDMFLLTFGCVSQGTQLVLSVMVLEGTNSPDSHQVLSSPSKPLSSVQSSHPNTSRFLDQSNISNAYVSGMKEDLKLYGNQLN